MFLIILTSVLVSTVVWGLIWGTSFVIRKNSRILMRIPIIGKFFRSKGDNKIGDVYSLPNTPKHIPYEESSINCLAVNACKPPPPPPRDDLEEKIEELENLGDTDIFNNKVSRKIIIINHRVSGGYLSTFGIDFGGEDSGHLTQKDATQIIDILSGVPDKTTIDIILNTNGGDMQAAEVIINALNSHYGKVRIYIPHYAMSAGTIISLAAKEIYLGKNAYMGPIDPQIGIFSAANIEKYCERLNSVSSGIVYELVLLLREKAEASMRRVKNLILKAVRAESYCKDIYEELASGKYNHDQPLFFNDLCDLIPYIRNGIPSEIMELFRLHNSKKSNFHMCH